MSTTGRPSEVVASGESGMGGVFPDEERDRRARATALRARIRELAAEDRRRALVSIASRLEGRGRVERAAGGPRTWDDVTVTAEPGHLDQHAARRFAPSWLISALAHCLLLVVLAIMTFDAGEFLPSLVIASGYREPEAMPTQPVPLRIEAPPGPLAASLPTEQNDSAVLPELGVSVSEPLESAAGFSVANILGDPFGADAAGQGAGGGSPADSQAGAQFFGVQAGGNNFVFVVDSSTSMRLKFADALRELESSLRGLAPSQQFYVIFFDRNAERMTLGKWNKRHTRYVAKLRPEPDMVPATEENIEGCVRWMHLVQLEQWTNPHTAMAFALKQLRPDAIFLLSDGEFTDRGLTEEFLQDENLVDDHAGKPRPKVIIHCIGFYSREGEVTLQRIAETYGGTYRFVEPPPGFVPRRPGFPGRGWGLR